MIYRLLLFCSLFLALGSLCIAQEKGVITGTVRNSETKEIITGANIRVEGTLLGSVSNIYGVFLINNLPVKTYTLIVSMLGFETKKVENIEASSRDTILLGGDITIELEPMPVQTQPVIVTASKREQNIEEIPASVSVIDSRLLTSRNSVAVDDALRYVSGVNFIQSQVNIRGSTGYSKGVGTRVLILVDGLPMLSGDTGEIIWESFPVSQIERVEIVKGAGSALFGSNALGGVINLITKSGSVTPETHLQVYGGVYESPYYDEWKWTDESRFLNGIRASHQQQFLNGSLFLAFNRTEDDGYQKNNHWTRWNGWAKLDALLSTDETLTMAVGILDQRRGNFLYWKDLQHALEPTDDQLAQKIESLRWTVSMMYKTIFSSQTFLTFKTSLFRTRWEDNIPHPYDADGERSEADNKNGEIQIVHQVSENNIVTGGLYGNINTVDSDSIFGKHSGRSVAAYVQDEVTINEHLRATIGGRFDVQNLEGVESESQFNPKFGLTYNPLEGTHLRASVGRGYRAPSVAEVFTSTEASGVLIIPNPNLRSEHSWSYEVGGTQILSGNMMTELSLFRNEFWDLIEPTFNQSGQVQFQNITRARIQGIELNFKSSWLDNLLAGEFGYTYIYPEDISKNDLLKYRPRHLFYAACNVSFHLIQLGVDFRFISKADRIDDEFVTLGIIKQGDSRVPAYITDAHLNVDWGFTGLPLSCSFHANNIFNYNYMELIGNIAPIRNYVLTLEAKL